MLSKAKTLFNKAEDFVEDKIDVFEKSGIKGKIELLADKAEDKAEGAFKKMKTIGKNLADKAGDKFDEFTGSGKNKPKG